MSHTDADLVEACLDGQPEVYRQLLQLYQNAVISHLAGRLGDRHQAEEAAQESFVRAYFALNKLRKPEQFFPWLLGIADRVSMEMLRERKQERLAVEQKAFVRPEANEQPQVPLAEAVAKLPEGQREIVLLRYYGGISCREVSQRLGIPLGTVTKQLSRAYAALRQILRVCEGGRDRPEVRP